MKINKLKEFPIGFVGTCLGFGTLSNVYNLLGYTWVRHFFTIIAGIVATIFIFKVILFFPKCREEYQNTLLASMYTTITMSFMLFGSYLTTYNFILGKSIFLIATFIHIGMILFFTIYHIFINFKIDFLLPSYFVTYNGLLVSTVSGINLMPTVLALSITYYGIIIYAIILLFLIPRMIIKPIPLNFVQTKNILLAPCSLCFVSYLNFTTVESLKPYFNPIVLLILYLCIIFTFIYVLINIFNFFKNNFTPVFAGLTFPIAIATLASLRAGIFFSSIESYKSLGIIATNITGFKILIASTFMCLVFFNFIKIIFKID